MSELFRFLFCIKQSIDGTLSYKGSKEFSYFHYILIFALFFIFNRFVFYFLDVFIYYASKQRQKFYGFIKNGRKIKWIFDCFFSLDILINEVQRKQWKKLIPRIIVISVALWWHQYIVLLYFITLAYIFIITLLDFAQHLIYSHRTTFDFQILPSLVQQRFHQLQPPIVRYRFSKAFFKPSMFPSYNKLFIDELSISKSNIPSKISKFQEFYETEESFYERSKNYAKSIKCLKLDFNLSQQWKINLIKKLVVIQRIRICGIPEMLVLNEIPLLNNLKLKELIIKDSFLTMEDFEQIAKLNLESILLELKNDGTQFLEKIKEILVACEGTSKIRITYFRECENKAEFEEYMSEWLYKNVEVKSICCRDDQLNSCFSFGIEWDEI